MGSVLNFAAQLSTVGQKNKHPGRISHLDVTSGPGITSGAGRTSHPVIPGVCMAIYLSYVCHTGPYGHIWAYMGQNFANHSPAIGGIMGIMGIIGIMGIRGTMGIRGKGT